MEVVHDSFMHPVFFLAIFCLGFPTFCVSKLLGLVMAIVFGPRISGSTMLVFFPIFFCWAWRRTGFKTTIF